MKYLAIFLLPFVVYFGLGWLARDIYFSINEITGSTTMQEIYRGELFAVSFLVMLYNGACELIKEKEYSFVFSFIPLVVAAVFAFMPMSVGAAALCTILQLGTMIAAGYYSFVK